jgi:hypothetical protein
MMHLQIGLLGPQGRKEKGQMGISDIHPWRDGDLKTSLSILMSPQRPEGLVENCRETQDTQGMVGYGKGRGPEGSSEELKGKAVETERWGSGLRAGEAQRLPLKLRWDLGLGVRIESPDSV